MAARTALTPVTAVRNGSVVLGSGATPDATNGNIVAGPVGAFRLELQVTNAHNAPHDCIIRASGYAGVPTGAANTSYAAGQYQPFAQAAAGDLTVTVTNGTTAVIGPLDTDRFAQSDGSLWIDWSASTSMTVFCIQRPYLP